MTAEIRRITNPRPRFQPMMRMLVERGDKTDWDLLHELHYKAVNTPAGSRYWKLSLDGETIGVMVSSSPKRASKACGSFSGSIVPKGIKRLSFGWQSR